jgi:ribosomal 50S subunit-recycling heat shock protein
VRLDKFLKVMGIIRRRTVAKESADGGRVEIDGRKADAATTVRVGQRIRVNHGRKVVTYEVLAVPERPPSRIDATEFVRVVDEVIREDW